MRLTVAFLFTDIQGSTHLLQQFGDDLYAQIQSEHRRLIGEAFEAAYTEGRRLNLHRAIDSALTYGRSVQS